MKVTQYNEKTDVVKQVELVNLLKNNFVRNHTNSGNLWWVTAVE